MLEYSDDTQLSHHVETMLVAAISRDQDRTDGLLASEDGAAPAQRVAEVWPRVVSEERLRNRSRGPSVSRNRYLVLRNTGSAPARGVRFDVEKARATDPGSNWSSSTCLPRDRGAIPKIS